MVARFSATSDSLDNGYRDTGWMVMSAARDIAWLFVAMLVATRATAGALVISALQIALYLLAVALTLALRFRCSVSVSDTGLAIQNPLRRFEIGLSDISDVRTAVGIANEPAAKVLFYDGLRRRSVRVAAIRGADAGELLLAVRRAQGSSRR